jgi:nitrogen regulatory protein PII
MTVVDVRGFGRGRVKKDSHRSVDDLVDYMSIIKIEIVCTDELVEELVSIIEKTAHTGLRGDGKIYVSGVEAAVRISSGERGEAAV